jgi:hypothetical protein
MRPQHAAAIRQLCPEFFAESHGISTRRTRTVKRQEISCECFPLPFALPDRLH